jgi:hypothetical protein
LLILLPRDFLAHPPEFLRLDRASFCVIVVNKRGG